MHIAFVGNGRVTRALSHPLGAAGHDIVIGSRNPSGDASATGVVSHAEAVAAADVVVNAVPGAASVDVFRAIGAAALQGKILVDPGNAVTPDIDLLYSESSLAERLQRELPDTHVVKTANTTSIEIVANPGLLSGPTSLYLSGNNVDAKKVVRGLLSELGWTEDSVLDLGGISTARAAEHYFLLHFALMQSTGQHLHNLRVVPARQVGRR